MSKSKGSLLFLGKKNDEHCEKAIDFCQRNFAQIAVFLGKWGDPLPEGVGQWGGDYIISYLSRWVVPEHVLQKAKIAAINFHPAPPEYPGIGCINFALYKDAKEYGVTCHHMASRVDTGQIIAVKRFPILPADDVASLLHRTHDLLLVLFHEVADLIIAGKQLPASEDIWHGNPTTRNQLEELGRITPDMSREETIRRIRAFSFDVWKPTIELHGFRFEMKTGRK